MDKKYNKNSFKGKFRLKIITTAFLIFIFLFVTIIIHPFHSWENNIIIVHYINGFETRFF